MKIDVIIYIIYVFICFFRELFHSSGDGLFFGNSALFSKVSLTNGTTKESWKTVKVLEYISLVA